MRLAQRGGGAIYVNAGGRVTITESTLSSNLDANDNNYDSPVRLSQPAPAL